MTPEQVRALREKAPTHSGFEQLCDDWLRLDALNRKLVEALKPFADSPGGLVYVLPNETMNARTALELAREGKENK